MIKIKQIARVSYQIQITAYYSSPLLTMSMPLNSLSTLTNKVTEKTFQEMYIFFFVIHYPSLSSADSPSSLCLRHSRWLCSLLSTVPRHSFASHDHQCGITMHAVVIGTCAVYLTHKYKYKYKYTNIQIYKFSSNITKRGLAPIQDFCSTVVPVMDIM